MRLGAVALAVVAAALAAPQAVRAATFTVDTPLDRVDAHPGDGRCDTVFAKPLSKHAAVCSLRAAVQESNADPGADTIVLGPGSYELSVTGTGEDASATGDLDVSGALRIDGSGVTRTAIDGRGQDRVLDVLAGGSLVLTGVELRDGSAQGALGGGIRSAGTLTLADDTLEHNAAADGAAVASFGMLSVTRSAFAGNGAAAASTIRVLGATAALVDSTLTGNPGAALVVGAGASATVTGSSFAGNGVGIGNSGSLVLARSTISASHGVGVANTFSGSTMSVTNTTVVGNMSSGVYNDGVAELVGVTIAGNRGGETGAGHAGGVITVGSGTTKLRSSLLAGNLDVDGAQVNCYGLVVSLGHNLDSGTSCGLSGPGDRSSTDPMLLPLADNGGSTETEALAPGSPAVDTGDCGMLAVDQRGVPRPAGAGCDIGAYEFADVADLALSLTGSPTSAVVGDRLTFVATVHNTGPRTATGVRLTAHLPSATSLVSVTASTGSCTGTTSVTCELGALADEAAAKVVIVAVARAAGRLDTTAVVRAQQIDPTPANDEAELRTDVRAAGGGAEAGSAGAGGGGSAGSAPGTTTTDKTVSAQLRTSAVVLRRRERLLRIRLTAREPLRLTIALIRRNHTVLTRRRSVRRGTRTLSFVLPRKLAAGPATLRIVLRDDHGNARVMRRAIRIPTRPA